MMWNVAVTMIVRPAHSASGTCVVRWKAAAATMIANQVNSVTGRTTSVFLAPTVSTTQIVARVSAVTRGIVFPRCVWMTPIVVAS